MGKLSSPAPVKLIIGLIFKDEGLLEEAERVLRRHFGPIDHQSKIIPFTYTDYYRKELGSDLSRKFISFQELIPSEKLGQIKILTNKIEDKFSRDGLRRINIDPGYLTAAKLVLASTKDYSHRIHLEKGVFVEITLCYRNKNFQPMDWAYPDYRSKEYLDVFKKIREIYARQTG